MAQSTVWKLGRCRSHCRHWKFRGRHFSGDTWRITNRYAGQDTFGCQVLKVWRNRQVYERTDHGDGNVCKVLTRSYISFSPKRLVVLMWMHDVKLYQGGPVYKVKKQRPGPRVLFSQFQPSSLARVRFSRFLSGKGVVFRPNSLARGVLWSWFDTKMLARPRARVVILPVFFRKGWEIFVWEGKAGYATLAWAAQPWPIHNLVKSPPRAYSLYCSLSIAVTYYLQIEMPAWVMGRSGISSVSECTY